MNHQTVSRTQGWPTTLEQGVFSAVVSLILIQTCAGQSVVVTPSQPIVAMAGEDVTLPCHLDPAANATVLTVEWRRADLSPRFVYVWRDGMELKSKKHPSFVGRSSVFTSKLGHGDLSLKLQGVQLSDKGRYGCFVPTLSREATVKLVVGEVSPFTISFKNSETAGMVVQCESKGWYPEPEVLWLDSAGNLLSDGTTETLKGPDGLFTVSSRLSVEKSDRDSFTCRVHQKNINQTRQIHIHVPDYFLNAPCSSDTPINPSLVAGWITGFTAVCATVILCYCKRKQKCCFSQSRTNTESYRKADSLLNEVKTETLQDVDKTTKISELDEKKAELDAKLKEIQNGLKDVFDKVNLLMIYKRELETQRTHKEKQLCDAEPPISKNKGFGVFLKKTMSSTDEKKFKIEHETAKKELEDTNIVLKWVLSEVANLTERKESLNSQKEEIRKQLLELEEQNSEIQTNSNQTTSPEQFALTEKQC